MSTIYEAMPPGGHETYATSIFSKIKTYLDSNPYTPYKGNLSETISSGSPAAELKTYWDDNNKVKLRSVNTAYNTSGLEYTFLLSKGKSNQYGTILRWSYANKYLEILRKSANTWQSTDWEKIYAGYADFAGADSDGNTIHTTYVKRNDSNSSYTSFKSFYQGYTVAGTYIRILIDSATTWTMMYMELSIRNAYNAIGGSNGGKLIINGYHGTNATWKGLNAFAVGKLENLQMYSSDGKYLYIKNLGSYATLSIDKMLMGDSIRTINMLNRISIDGVDELPETYATVPIYKTWSTFDTASLGFNRSNSAITYKGTKATYDMIRFIDNTSDNYGNGIVIGGGGQAIIGGGESSTEMMNQVGTSGTEIMYIGNDTDVNIFTNLQNGWLNRKTFTFDTSGNLTATKFIGALQGNADTATSATTASKLGSSNVGSATQPIYLNGGTATACTYTLGKSVPSDAVFTDTKNTAGSTDTSSKIFLIGATSQAANPQTYSQDTAYVGTDGCLYSGGTKVLTAHQDISGKADKSATVSNVAWSNNKLTKTINGTTSDVVSASDILDNLTSSQVTTALGYVPGPSYEFESSDDSINISASMVPGSETIDLKLNSVSWNNISGKPSTFAPSAHDHNYLASAGTNTQSTSSTAYALGTFNVRWFNATGKLPGQPAQYGFLLTTATGTSSVENHQIFVEQPNGNLYHRGTNAPTSSSPPAFKTILDSSNYTSFTRNSSGVIKVNSVTKTPTNAGTSLASPTPIIDSGYKFLCWLYVQSNGYIVGTNYPGGAANPSATWWFANGYLANYGLTFYYLEIKDTI